MIPPDQSNILPPSKLPSGDDELLARKIRTTMLPRRFPSFEGVELGFFTRSGRKPGGDLFDVLKISEDVFALVMFAAQCSGMRSVLITAMAKVCFSAHIYQNVPPAAVIERVNEELARGVALDLQLSAFVGYLDLHDNLLTFSNAGYIIPLIYRGTSRTVESLYSESSPIEPIAEGHGGWEEEYVHLSQGDCLILHSDGLYQLEDGGKTGSEVSRVIRNTIRHRGCDAMLEHIGEIADTKRSALENDVSLMYAEILTQSRKNQIKEKLGFNHDEIVYLQFLNYLEEMDLVTGTILTAMDVAGYPDERIRKMKIVLTELLVNAIIHGNNRDASKRVVVGHVIERQKMVISILDEGRGFDPMDIPDPTLPENLEKPCGRGLFIVRHYVDSIAFNETGNRVTISIAGTLQV